MSKRTKKRLFDLLRILICAGALWFVVRGVTLFDHLVPASGGPTLIGRVVHQGGTVIFDPRGGVRRELSIDEIALEEDGTPRITLGLISVWTQSDKRLLLIALMIHMPVALLQGLRLRWLLSAQDIRLSFWECAKVSWAGNFLNFATPLGSNAGDVFKAYFTALHTEKKAEAVTTIVIDRVVGLATLLLVVALITTFSTQPRLAPFRPYLLGLLSVGVLGAIVYFSPIVRRHPVTSRLVRSLPMQKQLIRADATIHALAKRKATIASSILLTVALQALAMAAYFTVAKSVGLLAHLGNVLEYYSYFYVGSVIQALPGPPQGLGTVELAYRHFLAPFGSASQIVCVALLIRVVVFACALPGLLVTLTGSYKPQAVQQWQRQSDAAGNTDEAVDDAPIPRNDDPVELVR